MQTIKILGVIPARFASTRFPGKPLTIINGKSMIQRVYEQASKSNSLSKVVVATDDERIATEVERFGGEYIMTAATHQSGTDRCAEVAAQLPDFDIIINIQGDEPYINPEQIDLLASCFEQNDVEIATLVKSINDVEELFNTNIPKVVLDNQQNALYFSRQTLPYLRNEASDKNWINQYNYVKHIGIYAYKKEVLSQISKLKPSGLELAESLEQLRWIENGYRIRTKLTTHETIAVDCPDDLEKIKRLKL